MGKQKIVMRVPMEGAKGRSKAMMIAAGFPDVTSAGLEGEERDRIVVVGEGVDSIALTLMLRKRMGFAELVSVGSADEKKGPEKEAGVKDSNSMLQSMVWPYQGSLGQPYIYEYGQANNYNDPSCCIM